MITTRAEWRKLKEKHGIPDGVCKFSMGERFDSWGKKFLAANTAHNYKGKADAAEGLLKDLHAYDAALKTVKPTKFKGKTLAEQTKNLNDTKAAVHAEINTYDGIQKGNAMLANPLQGLKQRLTDARSKLNGIHDTDSAALGTFYSVEYRNLCGQLVDRALAANPTGKLKAALDNWHTAGNLANGMINSSTPSDPKKIYAAMKMGIEGLAAEVL